jgi:hypothetical protein
MIVYAGLLFSALTVLGWSTNMFGSKAKALGFTLLLEGIMMTSSAAWLTAIALTYLVLINAVANGCRLALRDAEPVVTDWASNLGRAIAAAAAAGAATAAVTLRTSDRMSVAWPANLAQAIGAAAGATAAAARKPTRARRRRRSDGRKTQLRLAPVAPELWS